MKVPFTLGVVGHFGLGVRDLKKSAKTPFYFQCDFGFTIADESGLRGES
jgi:hypothetical protein